LETRVAQLGIVVQEPESVEKLNGILHQYGNYIIGRMGIPYHKRGINIISVVLDAPADVVSTISGKVGMLPGVTAKAVYAKLPEEANGSTT
jgi:putative iron-only hydrogenase system regulator